MRATGTPDWIVAITRVDGAAEGLEGADRGGDRLGDAVQAQLRPR